MTELGVYILGATALAILAAAGIASGNHLVVELAALSAGSAYVGQLGAQMVVTGLSPRISSTINLGGMAVSLICWLLGAFYL
jgi:hypothetical protein